MNGSKSYRSVHGHEGLALRHRVSPVLTLIAPTALSFTVFFLSQITHPKGTGNFYIWYKDHTVEANIIVNVLAQVLAFLQLSALSAIINYSTRGSLPIKAVSLNTLKFWNAISLGRVDSSLSIGTLLSVLIFAFCQFLPSIGWVAALTPQLVNTTVSTTTAVPVYSADPHSLYWNVSWDPFTPATVYRIGNDTVTYVPGASMTSTLLDSAAAASSNNSTPRVHPKSDGTLYSYIGRSYGLGSSVGLANITSPVLSPFSHYSYNETGYRTTVSCIYNDTSDWTLDVQYIPEDGGLPWLYYAAGALAPDSNIEGYAVASLGGNDSIVALIAGGAAVTNNIAITAGTTYDNLDTIQCAAEFHPSKFEVATNQTAGTITVSLLGPGEDVDPTSATQPFGRGRLQQSALWELTRLSQRNINLYTSVIGESLESNIERRANVSDWNQTTTKQTLDAVADSFEAMLDDILLAISSAELMVGPPNSHTEAPVDMTVAAVVTGTARGIDSIFAFNIILVLLCVIQGARTRLWLHTPSWDYRDIVDVLVGASRGGPAIANAFTAREEGEDRLTGAGIAGWFRRHLQPSESAFGLRVKLILSAGGQEALICADKRDKALADEDEGGGGGAVEMERLDLDRHRQLRPKSSRSSSVQALLDPHGTSTPTPPPPPPSSAEVEHDGSAQGLLDRPL